MMDYIEVALVLRMHSELDCIAAAIVESNKKK